MSAPDLSNDPRRQIALDPPRLRGVLHAWSVPVALLASIWAVIAAPTALHRVFVAIYGVGLTSMLLFSALFHRGTWTDEGWWRMRQLDHTGIYLMIAGSFTGIAGLALDGQARFGLLIAVWVVTAAGIAYCWLPVVPPFGLTTALYVLLAAMFVPFVGDLNDAIGPTGVKLLVAGCAAFFFGALALGARVPTLWPKMFSYHEVWHVVVVVCAAMHYVVLVNYAIPAAELAGSISG